MAHRTILTERQRVALFSLPTDNALFLRHYTLSDEDIAHIQRRRRSENRIGFALQLCAFRYPGRLLQPNELIPNELLAFVGEQIGLTGEELLRYAVRRQTRYQHSARLQALYGFRPFTGELRQTFLTWLDSTAEDARSNDGLAKAFLEECRAKKIIIPGASTVERLCASSLILAEKRIITRIAARLGPRERKALLALLLDRVDERITRFVWLRQYEIGSNSTAANKLLDRLAYMSALPSCEHAIQGVPGHRITRLRRQGERYYADGLRDLSEELKLAILAV